MYSDIPDELVLTMVATITFLWTSSPQQMEYFNFIIGITTLIKKRNSNIDCHSATLINWFITNDKSPGSKSHLFVLERMTAHIKIRGRNKFATPPLVLCSILLFHENIISQLEERCNNFFSLLVCALSEEKGMD